MSGSQKMRSGDCMTIVLQRSNQGKLRLAWPVLAAISGSIQKRGEPHFDRLQLGAVSTRWCILGMDQDTAH